MANEAELRLRSDSIEKTTSAIDALINRLEELQKEVDKVEKSNVDQSKSLDKVTQALKNAEIARKKATDMLSLEQKELGKLSNARAEELAAIKAREIAAKKGIDTSSKEYQVLLDNTKATELANAASKRLVEQQREKERIEKRNKAAQEAATESVKKKTSAEIAAEKAINATNAQREAAEKLLKLEKSGVDKLSDEYAESRGEILGEQAARLKNLKAGTKEYKQVVENTKAKEKATIARKRLTAEEAKARKGVTSLTDNLDDLAAQASLVDGPLGGVASRITTLSGIIKGTGGVGLGIAIAGVSVALGALGFQLSKGIGVAADAEVQMKTLEEQVRSTGYAAGFTAEQLDIMARKVAMSTLNSTQGVRKSIASLLSYTSVSGEIFERTIKQAEDIAVVKGQGTSEVVKKLGKALENPVRYARELAEWGIEFNDSQETAIKNAVSQKDIYQAQTIILDAVATKFGEVAVAQGDATFSGSVDTFNQKWEELFETLANKILPTLKQTVDAGSEVVDWLRDFSETDIETAVRGFKNELSEAAKEAGGYQKLLESVQKQYDSLYKTTDNGDIRPKNLSEAVDLIQYLSQTATSGVLKNLTGLEITPDMDNLPELAKQLEILKQKEEAIKAEIEAQQKASENRAKQRSADQERYLKELDKEVSDQRKLTELFLEYSNTRSKGYREAKARIDAEEKAKKKGLEVDEEALELIVKQTMELSDLTEQRVVHNAVLQKTKALESQQSGIQAEITLSQALQNGLKKNSDAYLTLSASLETANVVRQMGGDLTDEQVKSIFEETKALKELQRELRIANALKASDANSSSVQTLERQIALRKLLATGVRKNSAEYIKEEERLKALEVINRNAIDVGDKRYAQLLANADAVAKYRAELQKTSELENLGIVVNTSGAQQLEGSLSQIVSEKAEALARVDELFLKGEIDSKALADKIKQQLSEQFRSEQNAVLLPLGFTIDEEGNQTLLGSVQAVQAEARMKQEELRTAYQEGVIQSESDFLQRKFELEQTYAQKEAEAKIAALKKTQEYQQLTRSQEIAGVIKGGAEMLQAVTGNSKKLAKITKTMAIFQASASLVESIAEAASVPFPANIPLIAEATARGTQLIAQAKSLNEPSFAFGGVNIGGRGTGRSDDISANISRGESVVTAPATARYAPILERMNAGLPITRSNSVSMKSSPTIVVQGDASERTVALIEDRLRQYEGRVQEIAYGTSQATIQEEQEVGGFLNPI